MTFRTFRLDFIDMKYNISLVLLLLVCIQTDVWSQTELINRTRIEYYSSSDSNTKKNLLLRLLSNSFSLPNDSIIHYINESEKLGSMALEDVLRFRMYTAQHKLFKGNNKEAQTIADSIISISKENEDQISIWSESMGLKISGLIRSNQNKIAYEYSMELLKIAEAKRDSFWIAKSYNYIGWSNMELGKFSEAISWFHKSTHFVKSASIENRLGTLYSNLSSSYNNLSQKDSALFYINKAMQANENIGNLTGLCNSLNIRADIYANAKRYNEAEADLTNALYYREQLGDLLYIVSDLGQLSNFYASVGKYKQGIETALKGIQIARGTKYLSRLIFIYKALAENYKLAKDEFNHAIALEKIVTLNDSLYNLNSAEALADIRTKYDLQKKENIILQQEARLEKNKLLLIGSIILFVLIIILLYTLYRNYKHVTHKKIERSAALQKANQIRAVMMAKESERKRIAADLHDNLGAYAAAIGSNVKQLQGTGHLDPTLTIQLEENANQMVTQLADTIWVLKNEELSLTVLADRFKLWLQRLIKNYPEVISFYSENIEEEKYLTPAEGLNLFMILKECTTNALKHSACSELKIAFQSGKNSLITIQDNGKGMHVNSSEGNGIKNVKSRAELINVLVFWDSLPEGTRVRIEWPTTTN